MGRLHHFPNLPYSALAKLRYRLLMMLLFVGLASWRIGAEETTDSPSSARKTADWVLKQQGVLEISQSEQPTKVIHKPDDLPNGEFQITRVDFAGQTRIQEADLIQLRSLPKLQELNLSYARLGDAGLKSLGAFPKLQRLYLSETKITDQSLSWIAQHEQLESLDLSGTSITGHKLSLLRPLPQLSRLFLGRTPITEDTLKELAKMPKLSVLHLAGRELTAAELSVLGNLPELQELSLTTNDAGLEQLAKLSKLERLTLYGLGITDAAVPVLSKLGNLKQLRLNQTAFTAHGAKSLQGSLQNCRLLAQPLSRQSAFLSATGGAKQPVIRWQPNQDPNAWQGLIPRPAKLPGISRWQIETLEPRSEIRAVDLSPNGQHIACATAAGHVRIYDAQTFVLQRLIPAHPLGAFGVAWSPDGSTLASCGSDATIRLWNLQGRQQKVFKGHRSTVTAVAWSPDGKTLASAGWDHTVRLWNPDGTQLQELKGHSKAVLCVAWSPDSKQLASGGEDRSLRIWDTDGKELHVMEGHSDNITSLAWSSRGSRLASGSWDKTIRFWNPRTGRGGPILQGHTYRVFGLEWHPEGTMLASAGDRTLRLWTLDGTPVRTVKTEDDHILCLSWKHDGNEIATGSRANSLLRINNVNDNTDRVIGENIRGGVAALAWHPAGDRIAAGCWDRTTRLVTEDGRTAATLGGHHYIVRTLAWSPDGERLATGGDAYLWLWNKQGIPVTSAKEHSMGILSMAWSPDGKHLASVSEDKTARIWSPDAKVQQVIPIDPRARQVAWGPDSQQIATASETKVQLFDLRGAAGLVLTGQPPSINVLDWNITTNRIAAAGWSRLLVNWSADGEKVSEEKQVQGILDLKFDPTGTKAAIAMFGNRAAIANADGSEPRVWNAHAGGVNAICWHPAGHTLATGAYDGTLRTWDAETLEPKSTIVFFQNGGAATFTAAGQLLHGELPGLENDMVYLVQEKSGEISLLTPSQFESRLTAGEATEH